jgi:hypothetical protein
MQNLQNPQLALLFKTIGQQSPLPQHVAYLRAGSHYAQVERRSVTFIDQTMSRGEAFGLQEYIKIIHY